MVELIINRVCKDFQSPCGSVARIEVSVFVDCLVPTCTCHGHTHAINSVITEACFGNHTCIHIFKRSAGGVFCPLHSLARFLQETDVCSIVVAVRIHIKEKHYVRCAHVVGCCSHKHDCAAECVACSRIRNHHLGFVALRIHGHRGFLCV